MSGPKKRTRTLAGKTSSNGITIRPVTDKQGYVSHLVQGWKENGKWQRVQFKKREDAETFASTKRVEMENKGRAQRMILSPMTQEQHDAAMAAMDQLGGTYSLATAVESIVKRHYLNTHTKDEGGEFFRIVPDLKRRRAVLMPETEASATPHLRAV